MGLETGVDGIEDLVATNPDDGDFVSEGAAHDRLTKAAILGSFPNINAPVTATDEELNLAAGVASLDNAALIAAGTVMCFYQASAPLNWAGSDALSSHMLHVVTQTSGSGGGSGGSDSPLTMDKVPSHTHTFTSDSSGAHGHTLKMYDGTANAVGTTGYITDVDADGDAQMHASTNADNTSMIPSGSAHTHTGTTGANGSPANWTPSYASVILCTKNAYS